MITKAISCGLPVYEPLVLPINQRATAPVLLIFIIILIFGPAKSFAKIGVSPSNLEFQINRNESASQKIFIQNLDSEAARFSIGLVDDQYVEYLGIYPREILVVSQEIASVSIKVKGNKSLDTAIAIQTLASGDNDLAITSGIKIPVSVKVENRWPDLYLTIALVLVFSATGISYLVARKKLR